jgi:hypothetical protein
MSMRILYTSADAGLKTRGYVLGGSQDPRLRTEAGLKTRNYVRYLINPAAPAAVTMSPAASAAADPP